MKTPKQQTIDELHQTVEGEKDPNGYWTQKAINKCYQAGVTREEVKKILNQYKDEQSN